MSKMDVPLELQDPKTFGDLDEDQTELIELGALDLVLIENAAELVRQVMMDQDNIEKILRFISRGMPHTAIIQSETFPLWSRHPSYHDDLTGSKKEYDDLVDEVRESYNDLFPNPRLRSVIGIFAVEVEPGIEASGHYAAFYVDLVKKEVLVFDSMQQESEAGGFYSIFFLQLANDLFGFPARLPECIMEQASVQLTGGFYPDPTEIVEEKLTYGLVVHPRTKISSHKKRLLTIQSTESQNHFCYMWAIWVLHQRIKNINPMQTINHMFENNIDPIMVIKRYIWCLFHARGLNLVSQIPRKYRKFFDANFMSIWTNDPTRIGSLSLKFFRCRIPTPKRVAANNCVSASLLSKRDILCIEN